MDDLCIHRPMIVSKHEVHASKHESPKGWKERSVSTLLVYEKGELKCPKHTKEEEALLDPGFLNSIEFHILSMYRKRRGRKAINAYSGAEV
jgi:hypothetical protein